MDGRDYAGREILGRRDLQEDYHGVVPGTEFGGMPSDVLVLVADGMGGHAAGEIASSLVVETFAQAFMDGTATAGMDDAVLLWSALEAANQRVGVQRNGLGDPTELMGTTLVALLLRGRTLRWISVGDSPVFHCRQGTIRRLNHIHSQAADLEAKVRAGLMTEDAARNDPTRHALSSAIIGERIYEVDDPLPMQLESGDVLVVATDGIETLTESQIMTAVATADARAADICSAILRSIQVMDKPKQDNVTVVAVRVP